MQELIEQAWADRSLLKDPEMIRTIETVVGNWTKALIPGVTARS